MVDQVNPTKIERVL